MPKTKSNSNAIKIALNSVIQTFQHLRHRAYQGIKSIPQKIKLASIKRRLIAILRAMYNGIKATLGFICFLAVATLSLALSTLWLIGVNISIYRNKTHNSFQNKKNSSHLLYKLKFLFFPINLLVFYFEALIQQISNIFSSLFSNHPLKKLLEIPAKNMTVRAQFYIFNIVLLTSLNKYILKFILKPALDVGLLIGYRYLTYNLGKFNSFISAALHQYTTGGLKETEFVTKKQLARLKESITSSSLHNDLITLACTNEIYDIVAEMYKIESKDKSFLAEPRLQTLGRYLSSPEIGTQIQLVISTFANVIFKIQAKEAKVDYADLKKTLLSIVQHSGKALYAYHDHTHLTAHGKNLRAVKTSSVKRGHLQSILSDYTKLPYISNHPEPGLQKETIDGIQTRITSHNKKYPKSKILITRGSLHTSLVLDEYSPRLKRKTETDIFVEINRSTLKVDNKGWSTIGDLTNKLEQTWKSKFGLSLVHHSKKDNYLQLKNTTHTDITLTTSFDNKITIPQGGVVTIYVQREWTLSDTRINTRKFRQSVDELLKVLLNGGNGKANLKFLLSSALRAGFGRTTISMLNILPGESVSEPLSEQEISDIDTVLKQLSSSDSFLEQTIKIIEKFRFEQFASSNSSEVLLLEDDGRFHFGKIKRANSIISMLISSLEKSFIEAGLVSFFEQYSESSKSPIESKTEESKTSLPIIKTNFGKLLKPLFKLHNIKELFRTHGNQDSLSDEEHIVALGKLISYVVRPYEDEELEDAITSISSDIQTVLKPLTSNFDEENYLQTVEGARSIMNRIYRYHQSQIKAGKTGIDAYSARVMKEISLEYIYFVLSQKMYITPIDKIEFKEKYSSLIPQMAPNEKVFKQQQIEFDITKRVISFYLAFNRPVQPKIKNEEKEAMVDTLRHEREKFTTPEYQNVLYRILREILENKILSIHDISEQMIIFLPQHSKLRCDQYQRLKRFIESNLEIVRKSLVEPKNKPRLERITQYSLEIVTTHSDNTNRIYQLLAQTCLQALMSIETTRLTDESIAQQVGLITNFAAEGKWDAHLSPEILDSLEDTNPALEALLSPRILESLIFTNPVLHTVLCDVLTPLAQNKFSSQLFQVKDGRTLLKHLFLDNKLPTGFLRQFGKRMDKNKVFYSRLLLAQHNQSPVLSSLSQTTLKLDKSEVSILMQNSLAWLGGIFNNNPSVARGLLSSTYKITISKGIKAIDKNVLGNDALIHSLIDDDKLNEGSHQLLGLLNEHLPPVAFQTTAELFIAARPSTFKRHKITPEDLSEILKLTLTSVRFLIRNVSNVSLHKQSLSRVRTVIDSSLKGEKLPLFISDKPSITTLVRHNSAEKTRKATAIVRESRYIIETLTPDLVAKILSRMLTMLFISNQLDKEKYSPIFKLMIENIMKNEYHDSCVKIMCTLLQRDAHDLTIFQHAQTLLVDNSIPKPLEKALLAHAKDLTGAWFDFTTLAGYDVNLTNELLFGLSGLDDSKKAGFIEFTAPLQQSGNKRHFQSLVTCLLEPRHVHRGDETSSLLKDFAGLNAPALTSDEREKRLAMILNKLKDRDAYRQLIDSLSPIIKQQKIFEKLLSQLDLHEKGVTIGDPQHEIAVSILKELCHDFLHDTEENQKKVLKHLSTFIATKNLKGARLPDELRNYIITLATPHFPKIRAFIGFFPLKSRVLSSAIAVVPDQLLGYIVNKWSIRAVETCSNYGQKTVKHLPSTSNAIALGVSAGLAYGIKSNKISPLAGIAVAASSIIVYNYGSQIRQGISNTFESVTSSAYSLFFGSKSGTKNGSSAPRFR